MFINDQQTPAWGWMPFIWARDDDAKRFGLRLSGWPKQPDLEEEKRDFCKMWAGC